jgi:hypothetical protein
MPNSDEAAQAITERISKHLRFIGASGFCSYPIFASERFGTQVERKRARQPDKRNSLQNFGNFPHLQMLKLGDPIAAVFTVAASSAGLRFSEPEIMLPTGTDLTAKTTYSTVRSIAENQ